MNTLGLAITMLGMFSSFQGTKLVFWAVGYGLRGDLPMFWALLAIGLFMVLAPFILLKEV